MDATPEDSARDGWAYSAEAEQSLLGALLLDNSQLRAIAGAFEPADFYTEDHRAIYQALVAMIQAGETADLVTVTARLQRDASEALAAAGGPVYLANLVANTPSGEGAARYASIVRERALARRLHALGRDLCDSVRGPGGRSTADLIGTVRARVAAISEAAALSGQIRATSAEELMHLDMPALEPLLSPWLFQKNLAMVHAKRGVGKTHFALACAFAIASGTAFLGWRPSKRHGVLYVDGEMPAQLMQRRLRELASSHGEVPELLRIITPDMQNRPMPDLGSAAGQAEIDAAVTPETALIVVDNLSCLVRSGGAENEAEAWTIVAEWALRHRRAGRAVLFVHHSGKQGGQRGTSKREDLLDVVIGLRRPGEYQEADGAVFEVHFEKARSLTGEDIAPIEAKLVQLPAGGYSWAYSSAATRTQDRIRSLWEGGTLTLIDVMREAGCSKSHAHQTLAKAMANGELQRAYPAQRRAGGQQ